MTAKGAIESVNAKVITIKSAQKTETFVLDRGTKYVGKGKTPLAFSDIKAGDIVTVRYRNEDGKMVAGVVRKPGAEGEGGNAIDIEAAKSGSPGLKTVPEEGALGAVEDTKISPAKPGSPGAKKVPKDD